MSNSNGFRILSLKRKNLKNLLLSPPAQKLVDDQVSTSIHNDATLSSIPTLGIEFSFGFIADNVKPEDMILLKELGAGNTGVVSKVLHLATGMIVTRTVS